MGLQGPKKMIFRHDIKAAPLSRLRKQCSLYRYLFHNRFRRFAFQGRFYLAQMRKCSSKQMGSDDEASTFRNLFAKNLLLVLSGTCLRNEYCGTLPYKVMGRSFLDNGSFLFFFSFFTYNSSGLVLWRSLLGTSRWRRELALSRALGHGNATASC